MSTPRFIRHITLQSGHTRDSFAGEVRPDVLALCKVLIEECLKQDGQHIAIPLPELAGYTIMAGRAGGRSLVGSVWYGSKKPVPLVNFAIATKSRAGARLWRGLHEFSTLPTLTNPDTCPPEPWIAVSIEPDIEHYAEALEWLGDFERCLAWAWLGIVSNG